MGKIRVLQIITRLSKGGASRFVISLCKYLFKENFEILLLSGQVLPSEKDCFNQLEKNRISYQIIPGLSRNIQPFKDSKAYFEVSQAIKKFKPHILHTHTSKAGILGRWAGKIHRVPIIIHQGHGLSLGEQWRILEVSNFPIMVKFLIWLEKVSARITDRIITYTQTDINEHLQLGIGKKEQFIPLYYGLNLEEFKKKEIDRKHFGLSESNFLVGTAGRLVKQKGLEYLIEAAKIIKNQKSKISAKGGSASGGKNQNLEAKRKIKFLIIGDGPLRKPMEEKVQRLDLGETIIFLGWREDLPDLLNAMDIYIQPSLYESFGIALAEAQACEVPVIATRVVSIPELIKDGETGLLISPENPQELASAICLLKDNPSLARKIGEAGANYVRENYNLAKVMEKFKELYINLLKIKN